MRDARFSIFGKEQMSCSHGTTLVDEIQAGWLILLRTDWWTAGALIWVGAKRSCEGSDLGTLVDGLFSKAVDRGEGQVSWVSMCVTGCSILR